MLAPSGDPPPPPCVRRMAGRDVWSGVACPPVGCLRLTPSTLPVGAYSLSKSIYDFRTSTRAPYVSAAPVRCRKGGSPRGCTARPVSRSCTAVSSTDRAESLGL